MKCRAKSLCNTVAGLAFLRALRAFRDEKVFRAGELQQDQAVDPDSPELDCSLKQCFQDMCDQNLLSSANERAGRCFLDFFNALEY